MVTVRLLSYFHTYIHLEFACLQVSDVKSNLNQIGFDIDIINQMVSGLVSY